MKTITRFRYVLPVACIFLPVLSAAELSPRHRLVESDSGPRLTLKAAGRDVILATGRALYSETDCRVDVTTEAVPEGSLIHYTVANDGNTSVDMPDLIVDGVRLPPQGVELTENWKNVRFKWGSSFMWSREVSGPCTFASYVLPGSETNVTIKKGRGQATQEWLDQLIEWGYTPIVFNSRFKLVVKRELLGKE